MSSTRATRFQYSMCGDELNKGNKVPIFNVGGWAQQGQQGSNVQCVEMSSARATRSRCPMCGDELSKGNKVPMFNVWG